MTGKMKFYVEMKFLLFPNKKAHLPSVPPFSNTKEPKGKT
jgi:hypothetical protein